MHRDELRSFFTTGFPKLFEAFYIQECLMQKYMPELYRHLVPHLLYCRRASIL